jgi:hypothetical protein
MTIWKKWRQIGTVATLLGKLEVKEKKNKVAIHFPRGQGNARVDVRNQL